MTSPEPYSCDLDSDTNTTLKVYLFTNVKNGDTIRKKVVDGEWECGVVKAALVAHPLQLAAAANRAVVAQWQGTMVTRTVYAEILYNLSLSKNISQSLSKFGIEKDTDLLVGFLTTPDRDTSAEVIAQIDGDLCPMSRLSEMTNMKEVKSAYKLNNVKGSADIVDVIVSRMVTKNFVSH